MAAIQTPQTEECPICKIVPGQADHSGVIEKSVNTPCGHKFGKRCLRAWFKHSGSCPMCRRNLGLWNLDTMTFEESFHDRFDRVFRCALHGIGIYLTRKVATLDANGGDRRAWIREANYFLQDLGDVDGVCNPRFAFLRDAVASAYIEMFGRREMGATLTILMREIEDEVLIRGHGSSGR